MNEASTKGTKNEIVGNRKPLFPITISVRKGVKREFTLQQAYEYVYGKDISPSTLDHQTVQVRSRQLRALLKTALELKSSEPAVPSLQSSDSPEIKSASPNELDDSATAKTSKLVRQPTMKITEEEKAVKNGIWENTFNSMDIIQFLSNPAMLNIIHHLKERLADKRVITVFLSSPFDGMEQERSIFREEYATQLEEICARKGYMLKFCDMRFGITKEVGERNETLVTCLRAAQESDVFLGCFGARYGSSSLQRKEKAAMTGLFIDLQNIDIKGVLQFVDAYPTDEQQQESEKEKVSRIFNCSNRLFVRIQLETNKMTDEYLVKNFNYDSNRITIDGVIPTPLYESLKGSEITIRVFEASGDWVLHDLQRASDEFPFVEEHTDKSVTDLEFRYSFLQKEAHVKVWSGKLSAVTESFLVSVGKTIKNFFSSSSTSTNKVVPITAPDSITKSYVQLEGELPPYKIKPGMNIRVDKQPLQSILLWNDEKRIACITPGFDLFQPSGEPCVITFPRRFCAALFRDYLYDQTKEKEHFENPTEKMKYCVENEQSRKNLNNLKRVWRERAMGNECIYFKDYANPAAAALFMFTTLKFLLPQLLPVATKSSREHIHENYAKSLVILPIIGRETVFSKIDHLIQHSAKTKKGMGILIAGTDGAGKSAIAAKTYYSHKESAYHHCIYYCVSCNAGCANLSHMISLLLHQFDHVLSFDLENKRYYENLSSQKKLFWLFSILNKLAHEEVSANNRFLLIIDGIHELKDDYFDGSSYLPKQLKWLPTEIPDNLTLLITSGTGEEGGDSTTTPVAYNHLIQRGFVEIHAEPLQVTERKSVVEEVLKFNFKSMDHTTWHDMWEAEQASVPLYLTLALHEIITSGTWSTLSKKVHDVLSRKDIVSLINLIFDRLEHLLNTVEDTQTEFVRNCLILIYCSRKGLTEAEIMELSNIHFKYHQKLNVKLSQRHWLALAFGLGKLLNDCSGLYNFSHPFVRKAVEKRFILPHENATPEEIERVKHDIHLRLATYFKLKAEFDTSSSSSSYSSGGVMGQEIPRALKEIDYHYISAGVSPPVTVAVRVRPFLPKELKNENETVCCITMKGKQCSITNPVTLKPNVFTVDFALWSCNNDCSSQSKEKLYHYASNETVWKLVGSKIVQQAIESCYDVSVFAYGQTGSGKTYTMFGTDSKVRDINSETTDEGEGKDEGESDVNVERDSGLIYLTCRELFRQLEANQNQRNIAFELTMSMIEIYQEKIKDLLDVSAETGLCKEKQVIDDEHGHPLILNLIQLPVQSWHDIEIAIQNGFKLRSVSGTQMNADSSRSHCIFTLKLTQVIQISTTERNTCVCKINLVDLAGSESGKTREALDKTKAKQILQEGISINKSLSVLNKCIRALAERSKANKEDMAEEMKLLSGEKKKKSKNMKEKSSASHHIHVPYRESKLTHVLKDSLGGRGKLILLATVSPDRASYCETLSTLNYASMAKQIESVSVSNAETAFLKEVQKQALDNIIVSSSDNIKFILPKSCANRSSRGSVMLADALEESQSSATIRSVIKIPRAIGRVLELICDYLRQQITLTHSSENEMSEVTQLFMEKVELTFGNISNGVELIVNGLVTSLDMGIEELIGIFQTLLSKIINRDPSIDIEKFYSSISSKSPEKRLAQSQQYIEKFLNGSVSLSGTGGYFRAEDGLLLSGGRSTSWILKNISPGKVAFMNASDGKYITAYGTGDMFTNYVERSYLILE
jgi:DNA replication protein DnaC